MTRETAAGNAEGWVRERSRGELWDRLAAAEMVAGTLT